MIKQNKCNQCSRLLFTGTALDIIIKCPKCKTINEFYYTSERQERLQFNPISTKERPERHNSKEKRLWHAQTLASAESRPFLQ
jgi:phage FluMu protein Com